MPDTKMSIAERFKYYEIQYERYRKASDAEKSELLDEMMAVTGLRRKSLIRRMRTKPIRKKRQKQRGKQYGAAVQDAIRLIARALDYPCRERLKPMLVEKADHLGQLGRLNVTPELREQLAAISVSTVGRILGRIRQDEPRLRRRAADSRVNQIQKQVPIRMIPWDEGEPGRFEVDLVFHSGPSAAGEFVCSLQMVDVATGWSEIAAILGRSFLVTRNGFERCLDRLPFPVTEIHSDNGSEFLNAHMLSFWKDLCQGIELSRTRPYHSQENRFVEHRNGALIRAMIGFDRLDTVDQVIQLNRVYDKIWLYFNFFQPVMRLTQKHNQNGDLDRRHDDIRTPFQRVRASGILSESKLTELTALYRKTDPITLRAEIDQEIDSLLSLPNATDGHPEDVYETLWTPAAQ